MREPVASGIEKRVSRYISQTCCPFDTPKFVRLTREPDYLSALGSGSRRADSDSGGAPTAFQATASNPGTSGPALLDLMAMDEAAWDEFSRGSAIRRARRAGFLRNVAVALGNWGSPEAVPALARALEDPEPLVGGHAAWAMGRIASAAARAALERRVAAEADSYVREEIGTALAAGRPDGGTES